MVKSLDEQIKSLQERQAQLKAREDDLKARRRERERKARTKRLIEVGAMASTPTPPCCSTRSSCTRPAGRRGRRPMGEPRAGRIPAALRWPDLTSKKGAVRPF